MDGVSSASAIIAIVTLSAQLYQLCNDYYITAKDARQEIQRLRDEVMSLHDIVSNVVDLAERANLPNVDVLNTKTTLISQCKSELENVTAALQASDGGTGAKKMRNFGFRALKWPLDKKQVDKSMSTIQRLRSTFQLALNVDSVTLGVAIEREVRGTRKDIATAKSDHHREKIIRWLCSTDPSVRHTEARKSHEPKTGEWFLSSMAMQVWKTSPNSLLWLHGIPGCGKTIMSSTVIENLRSDFVNTNSAVVFYYFDFQDTGLQDVPNCLSSLTGQLAAILPELPAALEDLYSQTSMGSHRAGLIDLRKALVSTLENFEDVYVIIDALDECPRNGQRDDLLDFIAELQKESSQPLHMLLTSRLEPDIYEVLNSITTVASIPFDASGVSADIQLHINKELASDRRLKRLSQELKLEIEVALVKGAHGMFRWVGCQLDALKRCQKVGAIRSALKTLPANLDATYERILSEIDELSQRDAYKALLWLTFSERELNIEELAESSIIDPAGDPPVDQEQRYGDPLNLLEILTSLVILAPAVVPEKSKLVRLAHFSVKEFLVSDRVLRSTVAGFGLNRAFSNAFLAKCCLHYIFYFDEIKRKTGSDSDSFLLFSYCSKYWSEHARASEGEDDTVLNDLIHMLFITQSAFESWLYDPSTTPSAILFTRIRADRPLFKYAALYCAAAIGLLNTVERLINAGLDLNPEGVRDYRPILGAAWRAQSDVLKLLVSKGAKFSEDKAGKQVSIMDQSQRTALALATRMTHLQRNFTDYQGTIEFLLGQPCVTTETSDQWGWSPLMTAAKYASAVIVELMLILRPTIGVNHMGSGRSALSLAAGAGKYTTVQLLLTRKDLILDQANAEGTTPLMAAASNGRTDVVELLSKAGAEVDYEDYRGRTPLYWASHGGHTQVVEYLMEHHNVSVIATDHYGRTPLLAAARFGHVATVNALLRDDNTSLNHKSSDQKTALVLAIEGSHTEVVNLLLQQPTIDVSTPIGIRETNLLMIAASRGSAKIVKMLLQRPEIDVNRSNIHGEAPLLFAAQLPYDRDEAGEVVQLLLNHGADADAKDNFGHTPLIKAFEEGCADVQRILLCREDVDVNSADNQGMASLHHYLSGNSMFDIPINEFLQHPKVDVNIRTKEGETPLMLAVDHDNEERIQALLDRSDIEVDVQDDIGWTAFNRAATKGNLRAMELILAADKSVRVDLKSQSGRSALSHAAQNGEFEIAYFLLRRDDVEADSRDENGMTPLAFAAEGGQLGQVNVVKLLLDRSDVDPNSVDKHNETPLFKATSKGHPAIVGLLLFHPKTDLSATNSNKQKPNTLLRLAAEKGHTDVMAILLSRKDVNVNQKGGNGQNALLEATRSNYLDVVKLLLEQKNIHINVADKDGTTPLIAAAKNGFWEIISELLGHKDILINLMDRDGMTPVAWAARRGNNESLMRFLTRPANVNLPDYDGYTPLMWTSVRHLPKTMKLILRRQGLKVNASEKGGATALSIAARSGYNDVVQQLLRHDDIDINATDVDGMSALSWAAMRDHLEVVTTLLGRHGLNANIADKDGYTALTWAAKRGNTRVVELLCNYEDVDVNWEDKYGCTPLANAARKGQDDVVKLLLNREDIETDAEDKDGLSAFDHAQENGFNDIANLIMEHTQGNLERLRRQIQALKLELRQAEDNAAQAEKHDTEDDEPSDQLPADTPLNEEVSASDEPQPITRTTQRVATDKSITLGGTEPNGDLDNAETKYATETTSTRSSSEERSQPKSVVAEAPDPGDQD